MSDSIEGVMYLTVRHDTNEWRTNRKLKPGKVTLRHPNVVDIDEVVIKLRVRMPRSAFEAIDGGTLDVNFAPPVADVVEVVQA